jgi:hypothetical protein
MEGEGGASVVWFETQLGQVIFLLHSIKSGSGPTQPPIAGNWGLLSRGTKGRDVNLTTRLHLMPRLGVSGVICLQPPLRFHILTHE